MAVEHDFFGLVESAPDGSLFWSQDVELADHTVTVDLTAPDEEDITSAALDAAAGMVIALESLDLHVRNAMVSQLDDRSSEVTEYLVRQQEIHGEELSDVLVNLSGDVHVDMIRSLRPLALTILLDEHGGEEAFAVMEYALDPGDTDDSLLANLDSTGDVLSYTSTD